MIAPKESAMSMRAVSALTRRYAAEALEAAEHAAEHAERESSQWRSRPSAKGAVR